MRVDRRVALVTLLTALTLWAPDKFALGGEKDRPSAKRGEKASTQMSAKGQENTNTQWSADPDRGWVRAGERHELHAGRKGEAISITNRGKKPGKGDKIEKPNKKGSY